MQLDINQCMRSGIQRYMFFFCTKRQAAAVTECSSLHPRRRADKDFAHIQRMPVFVALYIYSSYILYMYEIYYMNIVNADSTIIPMLAELENNSTQRKNEILTRKYHAS